MKSIKSHIAAIAAGAALLAALGPTAGHAAEPASYAGIYGGANNLKRWPATVGLGPGVSLPGELSLDGGGHVGVMIGRQTDNARFELEFQAGKFDVTAIQVGGVRQQVSSGGDYKALTFNAYRTQPFTAALTGYAGLGVGWGSASLPQLGFTGGCSCFPAASGSGLAYQARAGLEYKLSERHHTFAQYTLLSLPKVSSGGSPGVSYSRKRVNVLAVGYRYAF